MFPQVTVLSTIADRGSVDFVRGNTKFWNDRCISAANSPWYIESV